MTTAAQSDPPAAPEPRGLGPLYEIEDGMRVLADEIETIINDTELVEAAKTEALESLMARLAELQGDEVQKTEQCWRYRQNLIRDEETRATEILRLTEMNRQSQRRREWLDRYVTQCLQRRGQKIKTALFSCWLQANPPRVDLGDEAQLPPPTGDTRKFWRFTAPTPDKTAIKAALQAGETVGEAKLEQGSSIRWR